jgi:CRP-like cAMP-binding protein
MSPKGRDPTPRNRLLKAIGADDFDLLRPHLAPISLPLRHVVEEPNRPIDNVVFVECGMCSIVTQIDSERQLEVGIFGHEGMSGIPVILDGDSSPQESFVQVAGEGLTVRSDDLRQAMRKSPSLHQVLLRYVQAMMAQATSTSLANGRGKVEERLARWLLMTHDRVDGDELALIHEFLALMLGVRRAGVTEALHVLEGYGAIRTGRGRIVIADRARLEESAAGLYGVSEAEYRRLIG